jgi:hypothetical protein
MALLVSALAILMVLAASYQPTLGYGEGGVSNLAYPGLPAGQGIRVVNTFGGVHQDVYIPPQRQGYTFYLFSNIWNHGSKAVTIESVGLPPNSALTLAGPARYARPPTAGNGAPSIPSVTNVLHSVTLGPGDAIFVAIPVRSWPCYIKYSGDATVPDFYITYRFLFFTHTVPFPWNPNNGALILHSPDGRPGQPGVICVK